MPPKTVVHGTTTGYTAGCRCEPCRDAKKAYYSKYLESKLEKEKYREAYDSEPSPELLMWRSLTTDEIDDVCDIAIAHADRFNLPECLQIALQQIVARRNDGLDR